MKIVYQPDNAPMAVVTPIFPSENFSEDGQSIEILAIQIGKKDVPAGLPFWIVSDDSIPSDRSFRDAWMLDVESLGSPAGTGERA